MNSGGLPIAAAVWTAAKSGVSVVLTISEIAAAEKIGRGYVGSILRLQAAGLATGGRGTQATPARVRAI
jgi:hypothetical protein